LSLYQRKKREAINIIKATKKLSDENEMSISCSFGKDSIVMLHMVRQIFPDIKIMFINQGTEYPETIASRNYYKNKGYNIIEYKADIPADEYYLRRNTNKKLESFHNLIFANPIRRFTAEHKIKLQFIGLRKGESKKRLYTLSRYGHSYYCKYDNMIHINPICNFSGQDVWAYIAEHNIAYASLYDKNKFLPRELIRNCPFGVFQGWTEGKLLHLKYYYPEQFCNFQKYYDKVKCYV
jgi:phosphoadenosine phosphosulfate reductase